MSERWIGALVVLGVTAFACASTPPAQSAPEPAQTSTPPFTPRATQPSATPPSAPPVVKARTNATCAGDAPWVAQVGGGRPSKSSLMRFDVMRRRGNFGPEDRTVTFNEFDQVRRTSEEDYIWKGASPWEYDRHKMIVLRGASGAIPRSYGPPQKLASGVIEHPPLGQSRLSANDVSYTLFVFPDGTWARMPQDVAARFRVAFAERNASPPLPAIDGDVAWEECGALDPNDLHLPFDPWAIAEGADRTVARLFGSRTDGELVYGFGSPAAASRGAADQRARCARDAARCAFATFESVEGSFVRYAISVRSAPTSLHGELQIAERTPPLRAFPANAPVVPGTPASGIYQDFAEVKSDTCPSAATGKRHPSNMHLLLVTHPNGKATATLEPGQPGGAFGTLETTRMENMALEPGTVATHEYKHLCPGFALVYKTTILSVTGDTIRMKHESRHVGASCRPNIPSNCASETIISWKLMRKTCDARCDASYDGPWSSEIGGPAPMVDVTCSCP
jgi:hypothetical protein